MGCQGKRDTLGPAKTYILRSGFRKRGLANGVSPFFSENDPDPLILVFFLPKKSEVFGKKKQGNLA